MENKYIDIDGAKLFYKEKNSDALHTLFFFHGNSSSHRTWQQQFTSSLLSHYRLIAFDLPAHGLSDSAPVATDNYSLPGMAKLIGKAVLQLAGEKPYLLAGISLGTNIIAEMMALDITPEGMVLAGPCIGGSGYTPEKMIIPGTAIMVLFTDDTDEEGLLILDRQITTSTVLEKANLFTNDYKMVKDRFRSKIGQSIATGNFNDQVSLIKEKEIPVLMIFGAADQLIYPDYLDKADLPLWNNKIIKLRDAGHWVHLDEPELFNQLLAEFASGIFTKAGF